MATVTNFYTTRFVQSVYGSPTRSGVNESFATIRGGAGTSVSVDGLIYGRLTATSTTNQYSELKRTIMVFDTTSIPAGATVTSATLTLRGYFKSSGLGTDTLELVSANPASTSSIVAADYSTLGSTSFGSVSYASWTVGADNVISLNASGLSNITVNGISKFGLRLGWDLNNSFTGAWVSNQVTEIDALSDGTANPVLVVSYSRTFPTLSVNNISSLANVTTITTS
jgi:hypothetical protein